MALFHKIKSNLIADVLTAIMLGEDSILLHDLDGTFAPGDEQ